MSYQRYVLHAFNSSRTLRNIYSSRINPLHTVCTVNFPKNLSTAVEPSDIQNFNGDYGAENASDYRQNCKGYTDKNSSDFQHQRSLNPATGNQFQSKGNGNFRSFEEVQRGSNGSCGHFTPGYRGNENTNYIIRNDGNSNENAAQIQWNPTDNYEQNIQANNYVGQFQHYQSGNNTRSTETYLPSNNVGVQTPNSYYTNNAVNTSNNSVPYQQSSSVYNSPNTGTYQQNENQWSNNTYQGGNTEETQWNMNGNNYNYNNAGQYQYNPNNYYSNSSGSYQQINHVNAGEYQHSSNAYNGEYQQYVNENVISNNVEPAEEEKYKGTLEELDSFCKEGKVKEATEVLELLEKQKINIDLPQYLRLVYACGEAKAVEEAKIVHKHIIESISPLKASTYNKILDMFCKCGSMEDAYSVYNSMPVRNLTSWDTMITWLTKNDLPEDAIELFDKFKKTNLKPDGEIFIGVFSAFSVLGEIEQGMLHFDMMRKEYGIVPSMKHYVSVVDMLGNSGYLDEALEFIEKMPMEPSVDVWECLMNISRIQGNVELGDRCAEIVDQLDPDRLSNQSKSGLIPVKASDLAKEKEKKKLASQNLLEVKSRVHEYRAGDTSHPENDKIYTQLRGLRQQMKEAGYVAETRFVLHDVDQESKEDALLSHSERLAVSYGMFTTPARQPIRVIKNLRVCGDCHNALKIISKLVGRQLIMRDTKRFHHFQDGLCSCGDYW